MCTLAAVHLRTRHFLHFVLRYVYSMYELTCHVVHIKSVPKKLVFKTTPTGNGFPLAALVTTPAAAHGFTNGMEYFNTFGGCNAAMAAGRAVLRVIKKERLQQHAKDVGEYLQAQLKQLKVGCSARAQQE